MIQINLKIGSIHLFPNGNFVRIIFDKLEVYTLQGDIIFIFNMQDIKNILHEGVEIWPKR